MYYFSKKTQEILDCYRTHLELVDPVPIGFTGVASERPAPCYTHQVSADALWFAIAIEPSTTPADVLIQITSITPRYQWSAQNNATPQDVPIGAIAGISSQVLPLLPLIQPFFVKKNGVIQMQFTNGATSPVTGGIITWRGLKLLDPLKGDGWNYGELRA